MLFNRNIELHRRSACTKLITILFMASFLTLTGCDFFRHLAGMPDSVAIEKKREVIKSAQVALELERKQDSIKAIEAIAIAQAKKDSAQAAEVLSNMQIVIMKSEDLGGLSGSSCEDFVKDGHYVIVVGSFKSEHNSSKLLSKVLKKGYKAGEITFKNGYTAVVVSSSNTLPEVVDKLKQLKKERFCPKDAWILHI